MRAEIPDDADVRLVETEVHPARREEVDVAELAGVEQLLDLERPAGCRGTCGPASARGSALRRQLDRSRASSVEAPSGFSMNTCLPASSAAAASAWWVETGVAIATASSCGSEIISSKRGRRRIAGIPLALRLEQLGPDVAEPRRARRDRRPAMFAAARFGPQ